MARVVNIRSARRGLFVYIGRPRRDGDLAHHWGNPFKMRFNSNEERNRVCDEFEAWFEGTGPRLCQREEHRRIWMLLHLHKIAGKDLGCFCAPKRCHGETLLDWANNSVLVRNNDRDEWEQITWDEVVPGDWIGRQHTNGKIIAIGEYIPGA